MKNSNRPAQLQKLAKVSNFGMKHLYVCWLGSEKTSWSECAVAHLSLAYGKSGFATMRHILIKSAAKRRRNRGELIFASARQHHALISDKSPHWSVLTSDCRWQRRLAVRYNVGCLEQNGRAHSKLAEMVRIFIFVDVNIKQENMPPSTRSIKIIPF